MMEYHQIIAEIIIALDTSHLMKLIELFNSFYFRNEGWGWSGRTFLGSGKTESLIEYPQRSSLQTAELE